MLLNTFIKRELESEYHIRFDVSCNGVQGNEIITVKLDQEDAAWFFHIICSIKEKIRIIITCEPGEYGVDFVQELGKAPLEKRKVFCKYWEVLNENGKVSVEINRIARSIDEFLEINTRWERFYIRFTRIPYYDSPEDRIEAIARYIKIVCGMMLSLMDYEFDDFDCGKQEGKATIEQSKKYERNPINREICLFIKGYSCSVCGFNFEEFYGDIGRNFIHVHHSTPVSEMGENYIVDPKTELFPVCPNCHAMLHKKDPPFSIDELKETIKNNG